MNCGPILDQFGINVGSGLDQYWFNIGSIVDQCSINVGSTVDRCWIHFGSFLDQCWSNFGQSLDQYVGPGFAMCSISLHTLLALISQDMANFLAPALASANRNCY